MTAPTPARCAHRPTIGDLVVPAVSVIRRNGMPMLGVVHRSKALRCIVDHLCQICEQPLVRPIVVLVSDAGLAECYSGEAALHPECAAYSAQVCPFLNGRRDTYRDPDRHIGEPCPDEGCDCGGWVNSDPDRDSRRGDPAEPWWAVWLAEPYLIAVNDARQVHGLSWKGLTPLRVRPVQRETATDQTSTTCERK